jgi:ATP/maltotriose-dependent transcriptional regulator MalT
MLSLCASVASLYHQIGAQSRAAELAAFVYHHPVTEQETKDHTEKLFGSTLPRSKTTTLTNIVTTTLADLNAPLPDTTAEQPAALLDPLTPRELEVLHLIADGHSNRIIAEQLVITIGTVKSYTSQIYSKLGVSSRTQAVAQARDIGLIP